MDRAEPREPPPRGGGSDPCDLSSSHVEGRRNALAAFGHGRDGRRDRKRTGFGLLRDRGGCPVAVEAFKGNAADPSTLGRRIEKARGRFGLGRVALVGDRGMTAGARIRKELIPAGLDWISALKPADIRKLAKGPLTADVRVPDAVAGTASPGFPGERLMVRFNPRLRDERRRKRGELPDAMEGRLEEIRRAAGSRGSRLRGREAVARRVGADTARLKVAKRFEIECGDGGLSWRRLQDRIDREEALDGIHVVRTSPGAGSGPAEAVEACRSLAKVEQAFRRIMTGRLKARPVFVRSEAHVRTHVFLCMPACHAEWHMRKRLTPILFDEDGPEAARARRASPVAPAKPSPSARSKAASKRARDGGSARSLHTLLAGLSTVALNDAALGSSGTIPAVTPPARGQRRAFEPPGVDLAKMFPAAGRWKTEKALQARENCVFGP